MNDEQKKELFYLRWVKIEYHKNIFNLNSIFTENKVLLKYILLTLDKNNVFWCKNRVNY